MSKLFDRLYYYKKQEYVPQEVRCDVFIYGATPAGLMAAIELKKRGFSVAIAEITAYAGGMTTSGLGATDLGVEQAIGGLAKTFYDKVAQYYKKPKQFRFEPHVAQQIFSQWIEEYELSIYYKQYLKSVDKNDSKLQTVTMECGRTYRAKIFLDCTYEGDLMAMAGVTYHVGREATEQYKEIYNGVQFGTEHHKFECWVDPYKEQGNRESGLLFGIQECQEYETNGSADHRIQAYNFRVCLTTELANQIAFFKPPSYDASHYELLLRYIEQGYWDSLKLNTPLPNNKTDLNNFGGFSTDFIGMNHQFPHASFEERQQIYEQHVNYVMGLLYFLSHDDRLPAYVREDTLKFGLAKDEFQETYHFPPQLYIRECRRMISEVVMTENHAMKRKKVDDSIGMASFHMDSHHVRRIVLNGRVVNEGDIQVAVPPFEISYRAIIPFKQQCENLIVPVCLSASHIAYGSIRMEPVFMILGQSAAVAAAIALQKGLAVQDIDYLELQQQLLAIEQIVCLDETFLDNPIERMKSTFGGM